MESLTVRHAMTEDLPEIRNIYARARAFMRKTGNPNQAGELPAWIPSEKAQKRVLIIGEKNTQMAKPGMLKMFKTMLTNHAPGE